VICTIGATFCLKHFYLCWGEISSHNFYALSTQHHSYFGRVWNAGPTARLRPPAAVRMFDVLGPSLSPARTLLKAHMGLAPRKRRVVHFFTAWPNGARRSARWASSSPPDLSTLTWNSCGVRAIDVHILGKNLILQREKYRHQNLTNLDLEIQWKGTDENKDLKYDWLSILAGEEEAERLPWLLPGNGYTRRW
jgi:hypothetical protein